MHLHFAAGSVLTPMDWSGSMGSCAAGSASAATPRTLASSRYPCLCSGLIIVINLACILVEVSSIICDCYIPALVDKYNCFQLHVGLHLPSLEVIKLCCFLMLLVNNFRLISCVLTFAVPLKALPCWRRELHLGWKEMDPSIEGSAYVH